MNRRKLLIARVVAVTFAVLNIAMALLVALTAPGHPWALAFIPASGVIICLLFAVKETLLLRDLDAAAVRPDYAAIARMEREVYGREFEHDGGSDLIAYARAHVTSPGAHALLDEVERGRARRERTPGSVLCPCGHEYFRAASIRDRCYKCEEDRHNERYPDYTSPADLDQYLKWLSGYVKRGGKPTHFYDYPWANARFRYASTPLTIDSDYEYGANGRSIIVASGVLTERSNPGTHFGGWGHTKLYFMHGYRTNDTIVPVYSDPEFDAIRARFGHASTDTTEEN